MIGRVFELTTKEVTGVWRRSRGDEFRNFCSSANIVSIFMRWVGRTGEMKNIYGNLIGVPEGENLEDLDADVTLILTWILKR
jgi:hypothetical protein